MLARQIEMHGPISVAAYMGEANAHYYASRDPLGASGDFTTAPEISQMFGELIGLWLADLWDRAGRPERPLYVELGPGRGTLAADALRAMRGAQLKPDVAFVETSPVLRAAQKVRVSHAAWHDDLSTIPEDRLLLVVANEFFDALPIRQLVSTDSGWRERLVSFADDRFMPVAGPQVPEALIPERLRSAPPQSIIETSPASSAVMQTLARRIATQGGGALIIDYGHERTGIGDTLQSVQDHRMVDPWLEPGRRDLTAHVDFEALAAAADEEEVTVYGPVSQATLLDALGIGIRAAALTRTAPSRSAEIETARLRLTSPDQMGALFKALAVTSRGWPAPAGFA